MEIGPSSRYVYLNGLYNLARMQLPILRDVVDEYGDVATEWTGRDHVVTFSELYERLIVQMDLAFTWLIFAVSSVIPVFLVFFIFD